jgi:hypothetical protein
MGREVMLVPEAPLHDIPLLSENRLPAQPAVRVASGPERPASKAADLPDVPLLMDLAANDQDRTILRLLSASTRIGRPIFAPPDTPADRVKALRDAFDAMVRDPAFLEAAKKEHFDIDAVSGAELQAIVADMVATPEPLAERLRGIIE